MIPTRVCYLCVSIFPLRRSFPPGRHVLRLVSLRRLANYVQERVKTCTVLSGLQGGGLRDAAFPTPRKYAFAWVAGRCRDRCDEGVLFRDPCSSATCRGRLLESHGWTTFLPFRGPSRSVLVHHADVSCCVGCLPVLCTMYAVFWNSPCGVVAPCPTAGDGADDLPPSAICLFALIWYMRSGGDGGRTPIHSPAFV